MKISYHTLLWGLLTSPILAQNAAPADRTSVNSTETKPVTEEKSPVTFPASGALPAKYIQDLPTKTYPVEADYYLFSSPSRSLAQIAQLQQEMPAGEFSPPKNDWKYLPKTHKTLTEGGSFHLMAVGDSIINDTMRSGWISKLQEAYPKAQITCTVYVRGGGNCGHYKEEGRVEKVIIPAKPDLVYIGGISQRNIRSIREVILRIRAALPEVEFLLTPGVFGTTDPRDEFALASAPHSGTGVYGEALELLAKEQNCAYFDLTTPWRDYIVSSHLHPHFFYRDIVHANEHGEQILSKIMMSYWTSK